MLLKRGQLTIFIIVAILIIAFVVLFFVFRGGIQREKPASPEVVPIKNFVEECLDETAEGIIYEIAQQGGYSSPENIFESEGKEYAYYLINGNNHMPSKIQVEKEISDDLNAKIFICTNYFSDFPDYEITQGNAESSAKILENKIILEMRYPLTIKKGESISILEDFKTEIPVRAGLVYDSVSEFIIEQEKNKEQGFCLSCLPENLIQNNLNVEINGKINNTLIFRFKDNASKLNNKTFEWVFANQY